MLALAKPGHISKEINLAPLTIEKVDRWITSFKTPVFLPRKIVITSSPPQYNGGYSYYETDIARDDYDYIYLLPDIDKLSCAHEFNHCWDWHRLTAAHHRLLKHWWGIPQQRGWWWNEMPYGPMVEHKPDAGCEIFANRAAEAALGIGGHQRLQHFMWRVENERRKL